jgi:hypothetical protein
MDERSAAGGLRAASCEHVSGSLVCVERVHVKGSSCEQGCEARMA